MKHCPFCNDTITTARWGDGGESLVILCNTCGAVGPVHYLSEFNPFDFDDPLEADRADDFETTLAIKLWDTRAND